MKFRTLTLAAGIIAATPAVTVAAPDFYGKLNLSLERLSDYPADDIAATVDGTTPLGDQWQVESRKSRLGIRGEEALTAGGLDVIYQVEVGVDVDGDENTFSTRNSYLGVESANLGRIFAGRYDSVIKQIEGKVDQFNNTAADMETVAYGQRRLSNTLNWQSKDLQGMRFLVQAAPGEGVAGEDGLLDTIGAGVTLDQNGLYIAGAYEQSFVMDPAATDADEIDTLRLVATMNLGGGVQVGGMFEHVKVDPAAVGADEADGNTLLVSARVEANQRMAFKGQLAQFDSSDLDAEVRTLTLGADYMLGRQTKGYALVSLSDAEVEFTPTTGIDESGNLLSIGLEHNF